MRILFLLLFINCSAIKIQIQNGIDKEGIDIWDQNVLYVCKPIIRPDIYVYSVNKLHNNKAGMIRIENNYAIIFLRINHENILAHEFGHYLGYKHNDNPKSIMYQYISTNKKLKTYIEFKE
jgi:predicted Zn-dependent protease